MDLPLSIFLLSLSALYQPHDRNKLPMAMVERVGPHNNSKTHLLITSIC